MTLTVRKRSVNSLVAGSHRVKISTSRIRHRRSRRDDRLRSGDHHIGANGGEPGLRLTQRCAAEEDRISLVKEFPAQVCHHRGARHRIPERPVLGNGRCSCWVRSSRSLFRRAARNRPNDRSGEMRWQGEATLQDHCAAWSPRTFASVIPNRRNGTHPLGCEATVYWVDPSVGEERSSASVGIVRCATTEAAPSANAYSTMTVPFMFAWNSQKYS